MKGRVKLLSEKLYKLRKDSGFSQEQLAEQLGVSRQAVSKWESGTAIPESDKLIAISNYFGVSIDYLLKDDEENRIKTTSNKSDEEKAKMIIGIMTCIVGISAMILWGIISVFSSEASHQISNSSMITIDGNGIFLVACVVAIIVGASLLLKNKKK